MAAILAVTLVTAKGKTYTSGESLYHTFKCATDTFQISFKKDIFINSSYLKAYTNRGIQRFTEVRMEVQDDNLSETARYHSV